MSTETEKSPRDIATEIVHAAITRRVRGGSVVQKPWLLVDAVEQAISDDRERAARIIKEHRESDRCEGSCWQIITDAIRGKSNG